MEAIVTYPGLSNIISFNYTRGHGISPGFAMITCTPQYDFPARMGTLRMQYGNFAYEIKDCITDNLSFTFDESGQLWRLTMIDRRWKWRYGSISGRYNVRLPNGPVDKLDPRTEKTPGELIKLLLDAMGEADALVGQLPEFLRPSIYWDHANPAQELANLCDQFGMSIVLRADNRMAIFPRGFADLEGSSRTLEFPPEGIIVDSGAYDPPELPDTVKFVCGPSRFQTDLPLDAVGDDIDGLVKPINELSYAPKKRDAGGNLTNQPDWSRGDIISFENVPLFNPGDDYNGALWYNYVSPRELARASVFRKYRARATIKISGGTKSGYRPRTIEGYDKKIKDLRLLLPLGAELVEPTFDTVTGWYQPLNCIVWGIFARQEGVRNSYDIGNFRGVDEDNVDYVDVKPPMVFQARDPDTGQLIERLDATVIPPEEYSLDPDTGIFTFNARFFRFIAATDNETRKRKPAILWARIAVTICDDETFVPHREEVEFNTSDIVGFQGSPKLGTKEFIIRDDDIFLRVEPTYSPGNPQTSAENPKDNRDFIKKYARERVTAEMRKFQVLGPRYATYAGFIKADLTGDVCQVSYSLNQSGSTTSVSLNGEIAALVVSYSERRFLEKIRNEKLDQVMQAYNRMAFEDGYAFSKLSNLTRTGR